MPTSALRRASCVAAHTFCQINYDINGTRIYEMNTLRSIVSRNFTYSDEDHLLTAGTTSYQYDLDVIYQINIVLFAELMIIRFKPFFAISPN